MFTLQTSLILIATLLTTSDAKTPKIELEIIMSDVAIRYLGAFLSI